MADSTAVQSVVVNSGSQSARLQSTTRLVPLGELVQQTLSARYGQQGPTKLAQLKRSCASNSRADGDGSKHARIQVFRLLANWDEDAPALDEKQELGCMQLLVWLKLCSTDPQLSVLSVSATIGQAELLFMHLQRLYLIPREAKPFFMKVAGQLAAEEEGRHAQPEAGNVDASSQPATPPIHLHRSARIDADELVLRWMMAWNAWDEEDEIRRSLPPVL